MLIRTVSALVGTERDVDWGNGSSVRIILASDNRGFSLTETYIRPGSRSLLRYDSHLEACYCLSGSGTVELGDVRHSILPGTVYAPDKGEEHFLGSETGMRLLCVFNPALIGPEKHSLAADRASSY